MSITILLVEDRTIVRASLRILLEGRADIQVIGEADNGPDAIRLASECAPDVILMDIGLRGSDMTGIEATREIIAINKKARIIALSFSEKLSYVRGMLRAGACGYLSKDCHPEQLLAAIEAAMRGETYYTQEASRHIHQDYVAQLRNQGKSNPSDLTARELEVLRGIALSCNIKEIAHRLRISPKTVAAHRRNVMAKLNLFSDVDLTKYAIREKIIDLRE